MKYQVSFCAKTWYLHMWKYHLCYGYIINRAFHTKKLLKWNGLVFHWCLYDKWNVNLAAWRYEISLRVLKNISRISAWPCNILYFLCCIELTVQQGNPEILNTLNILSRSFIICSLMRVISGLIFILLLVFNYSTKITLAVLLALLYKRPVSIDGRNFSFY